MRPGSERHNANPDTLVSILNKTVYGGPMIVVLAAIEGAGHHAWCLELRGAWCRRKLGDLDPRGSRRPCFAIDMELQSTVKELYHPRISTFWSATRQLAKQLKAIKSLPHTRRV